MNNKRFAFLFATVLLLLVQSVVAQVDTLSTAKDSVNASVLIDFRNKLSAIEQQRLVDSVKRLELEAQLSSLKTTDNLKKEELQQQLKDLREKDARRIAQKKADIDALRATAIGFPVVGFFNDTLFLIYSKLGSFSAPDRAAAISGRIKKLGGYFRYNSDSLTAALNEGTVDVMYGASIIVSVSENDALWDNTTSAELANSYKNKIDNAVKHYKAETNIVTLAKEIALALLVIVVMVVLIRYTKKLFGWVAGKIQAQEGKKISGIKIKNYTLFDARREVNVLLSLNAVLKWFFILLIIYIALPVLFGIFPWTKDLADTLFGYILTPVRKIVLALWNYLPNVITIIVIVIAFRYILKGIIFLKGEIEQGHLNIPGFYPDWANPTYQIVKVLVVAFMVIVIFPYLPGSNSPVFQGVSVFLGFLFTFGSAGSLSNIVAGLVLTYMRLFRVGDRVKIGEVTGDVIEKTMLVTRIRTIKNEIISIPNSTVMNSHAINYSSDAPDKGLIIHSTVTIGYDVPWRKMHDVLIDAALRTDLVLKEPKPFVLQISLDDFYVSYQINAYVREANKQAIIYSDLHQNIQDVCNEQGIEIMSPHYRADRDGNPAAVPAEYLPKDYNPPAFKMKIDKDEQ